MHDPLFDLGGQMALISGASRGIGAAIAELLARFGAEVILTSRKREACAAVAESIRAGGGRAHAYACHIGEPSDIDRLVEQLDHAGLRPSILVNNAATNPYFGPMLEMPLEAYQKTVDVNIRGYWYLSQRIARGMVERRSGAIVNIASVNAVRPAAGQGVYSFTKAAIVSMTQAYAKELAAHGVRVNAVLPGLTDTKFASALTGDPRLLEQILRTVPLARVAAPDEIAPAVLYLCAPAARYVSGACLAVDGGYLA